MKSVTRERMSVIKIIFFALTLSIPMFSNAQNNREIKDFNQSFTFNNTFYINLKTNTNSETISGINAISTFKIDENGEGTIDFKTVGFKSTLVRVDYSQVKTTNAITYWNFGCTHSEKPEKIQMTIEINPESNAVQSFIIYNEGKEKAYVFH